MKSIDAKYIKQLEEKLEKSELEKKKLDKRLIEIYKSKTWKLLLIYKNIIKVIKGVKEKNNFSVKKIKGNFPENHVLGICCEEWIGVKEATINQCSDVLLIKKIDKKNINSIIEIIKKGNFTKIAINAIPDGSKLLIRSIYKFDNKIKIYLIWHGSFTQQTIEDHIVRFNSIKEEFPLIYKFGFCKKNMDLIFQKLGYKAEFIPNRISSYKNIKKNKFKNKKQIGILSSFLWHKNNLNQILSASLIDNSTIHTLSIPNVKYLDNLLKGKIIEHDFLTHNEFIKLLGSMDINLYISLTECYPMVFLESLILGVPCLVGKTVEPIIEDEEIKKYLVIQNPENILEIQDKINLIFTKYKYIKKIIKNYINNINKNNSKSILDFFKN